MGVEKWEQAAADCGKALRLLPKYLKAELWRARALVQTKHYRDAIKVRGELLKALEISNVNR
jgi:hypothetical protein